VIGLVVLAAIAGVAAVLWLNPALAQQIWSSFQLLIGAR